MSIKITGYVYDKTCNTLQLTFADPARLEQVTKRLHDAFQDWPDGFEIVLGVERYQTPPGYKMADRAEPNPYGTFRDAGWTDEQLVTADFLQKIDDASKKLRASNFIY